MNVDLSAGAERGACASAPASARCCWSRKASRTSSSRTSRPILRQADLQTALHGKDFLPLAGEYTGAEVLKGMRAFLEHYGRIDGARADAARRRRCAARRSIAAAPARRGRSALADDVHGRPPGFCTGCPERPIFSAMKLVERELGAASRQRRHRLPPVLDPAAVPPRQHDDGLRPRHGRRVGLQHAGTPASARSRVMGDGGFWHNGLTSGVANAVFNRSDNLTIVVDNNYTSATGGQDLLSSKAREPDAQHRPRDRAGGARRRRQVGPHLDAAPTTSPACATR